MISIILGFVVFWVLARKLNLSKSIVPAVAIGLLVFILCLAGGLILVTLR